MGDFTIQNVTKIKEKSLPPEWEIMTIYVVREINRIPWARITIIDGDFSENRFQASDAEFFEIGQKIRITHSDYTDKNDPPLFEGFVVRHSVRAEVDGSSVLVAELKDPVYKFTHHRKSNVWRSKTDIDIIKGIIKEFADEKGVGLESSTPKHEEMVQHNCTDWDFIVSRADVNGYCVMVKNGKISFKKRSDFLNHDAVSDHNINYKEKSIYNFHMDQDIREQYSSVSALSWDINQQTMTGSEDKINEPILETKRKQDTGSTEIKLLEGADSVEKSFDAGNYSLLHPAPISREEAQAWAKAKMDKDRLSFIEGRFKLDGKKEEKADKDIWPGEVIDVEDVAHRFNGKHVVTGVRHQVSENGWYVDIQFGTSSHWFTEQHDDIEDQAAAGLLPAIHGVHIGIVDDFESDKDGHFRIRVNIPGMVDEKGGKNIVWARMASPYASENRGMFFRPEVNDEVVLGFLNDDPRHAIILGSLYSQKKAPPAKLYGKYDKENYANRIMTETGYLSFNHKDKRIRIATLDKNDQKKLSGSINIQDTDDGGISIVDRHGNQIIMDKNGIRISSISGKPVVLDGINAISTQNMKNAKKTQKKPISNRKPWK